MHRPKHRSATPFDLLLHIGAGLALLAGLSLASAAGLPPGVSLALDNARIPTDAVSIWTQAVDAHQPTLSLNANRPLNPASTMKLVTAFAAFDRLGPAFTWQTRIATRGELDHGVLRGDLHLLGGADPVFDEERLRRLLRRLRGLGIYRVAGDIVLDGSVLTLPPHDPQAFDGRGLRPYNAGPYGLLMHYNTLQLGLFPAGDAHAPVTVIAEPPLAGLVIDNRLLTSQTTCEVWYRDLDARLEPGPRLVLTGSLPASCGPRNWSAAPLAPPDYAIALVRALWSELGGSVDGAVRNGVTPADAIVRLADDSRPLADVVRDMNKWSSNLIARQLLATLGMQQADAADAVQGGILVARAQLAAAGIDTSGLVIENGAGLSRSERIRADSMGALLLAAWRRPWMPEFISALPLAGVDGTARKRLNGSPANGQAHIKTGTLNGVRAMAGYLLDRNSRRHVVVMIVNHPEAAASQAAQDALLEWLWAAPPP
ncbi:D-alanyl-D-alanine carboxypeptidase/D-alanyl-D-alanine-endopeptidase [Azoarcus sp. DD4]|uniref:D-alanyl-D-alanine carboxypeptidase/D-alanyl-D-alanine endopeptidase n=1 Tax=Azoarcus sp. DD4 TaxID=2027405 RepID=UPI001129CA56|nr:D-alanyl-D-alanine carboxypeptidase/D-alanyl-D-alanine-endopeptidase [Azoarcus sp. DD4]QDF99089.1 D-alanyl-D-alanine carboxypeptidase/D-alanyl-D-alanine-endopeptidase [Azoarcus sp. DD4]